MEARVANHNEYRSLEGAGKVFSLALYSMLCTTWFVPGNPFAGVRVSCPSYNQSVVMTYIAKLWIHSTPKVC